MAEKKQDPNVQKKPARDQAKPTGEKVNLDEKANPTKPQQVQHKNVNRP